MVRGEYTPFPSVGTAEAPIAPKLRPALADLGKQPRAAASSASRSDQDLSVVFDVIGRIILDVVGCAVLRIVNLVVLDIVGLAILDIVNLAIIVVGILVVVVAGLA